MCYNAKHSEKLWSCTFNSIQLHQFNFVRTLQTQKFLDFRRHLHWHYAPRTAAYDNVWEKLHITLIKIRSLICSEVCKLQNHDKEVQFRWVLISLGDRELWWTSLFVDRGAVLFCIIGINFPFSIHFRTLKPYHTETDLSLFPIPT